MRLLMFEDMNTGAAIPDWSHTVFEQATQQTNTPSGTPTGADAIQYKETKHGHVIEIQTLFGEETSYHKGWDPPVCVHGCSVRRDSVQSCVRVWILG